ncbi:alpha/beta hydrolase [Jeotgalibacillus soli]|uniref:Esterase n=1 Tax=Jeotgalibacillus soli TaxID=889306 RepID=A0A0C2W5I5_9BACL|nr:alpha/beta hydrolase family protein [Jeotgalibacillus soli]KIL51846.1 hypothetical protein KP78_02160 [Jeotgalibacillus soli]
MALIQCNYFSEVLGLSTSMTVILPQQTKNQIGMKNVKYKDRHPSLFLLHGLSDDDTIWLRRTSIERYVASLGIAVVMPQVHRSFYTDMAYGNRYWTFLSEELPEVARSFFPLSDAREDNFVAGLSMGGYGAMKWALRRPEQFAAAASLSGVMDIADFAKRAPYDDHLIFGDQQVTGTENDLFWLIDQATMQRPKLYQACGTEDFLYEQNVRFHKACQEKGIDLMFEEEAGDHNWDYWDKKIQDVLAWLPLQRA